MGNLPQSQCLMSVSKSVEVLQLSFKSGRLGGGLNFGSEYGRTSLVNCLGFNGSLEAIGVKCVCSFCDFGPMLVWGCAEISDFCFPNGMGSISTGLLGCEGVSLTFFLRPALPCPNLGFFQVGVLT